MSKAVNIIYNIFESSGILLEDPELLVQEKKSSLSAVYSVASVSLFSILTALGLPSAKFSATNDSQTITEWQWATFSFANRTVATNTGIKQPNLVMVNMHLNLNTGIQMLAISTLMVLFKNQIDKYVARGGLFTVVLPSMTYTGCALQKMEAIDSLTNPSQTFKFTFIQPLVSATNLNNLLSDSALDSLKNGGAI